MGVLLLLQGFLFENSSCLGIRTTLDAEELGYLDYLLMLYELQFLSQHFLIHLPSNLGLCLIKMSELNLLNHIRRQRLHVLQEK